MENMKNQLVPPWVSFQSFKNLKWRLGKMMLLKNENQPLLYVVTSPKIYIFTKLSLLGAELQKCHYWALNVGPFT